MDFGFRTCDGRISKTQKWRPKKISIFSWRRFQPLHKLIRWKYLRGFHSSRFATYQFFAFEIRLWQARDPKLNGPFFLFFLVFSRPKSYNSNLALAFIVNHLLPNGFQYHKGPTLSSRTSEWPMTSRSMASWAITNSLLPNP